MEKHQSSLKYINRQGAKTPRAIKKLTYFKFIVIIAKDMRLSLREIFWYFLDLYQVEDDLTKSDPLAKELDLFEGQRDDSWKIIEALRLVLPEKEIDNLASNLKELDILGKTIYYGVKYACNDQLVTFIERVQTKDPGLRQEARYARAVFEQEYKLMQELRISWDEICDRQRELLPPLDIDLFT